MTEPQTRQLKVEIFWVFSATILVTGLLSISQSLVGWIGGYVLAIAALVFIYLPLEVLKRRGEDPSDFGIHENDLLRSTKHAVLVSLIVFPIYSVGFHVWQTEWQGRELAVSEARFDHWPQAMEDAPKTKTIREGDVQLFTRNDWIWMRWRLPTGQRFEATIDADGQITPKVGRPDRVGESVTYRGTSSGQIAFEAEGSSLEVAINAGGDMLPSSRLKLGSSMSTADENPFKAERSYWWIINLILVQLLMVALPEELFYRGYLQSRLDQIFHGDTKILGVDVNVKSVLLTSALFAIGHIITVPSPARLAVFFPSLLFGWMRRATGGIVAPILFHAACNLFVQFAVHFYS